MNLVMLDIDGTLTQSYEYDQEIFGLAIGEVIGCPPVNADLNGYTDKTSTGVTREAIRRITGTSPTPDQVDEVKRNVLARLERMYRESPETFSEISGATRFLERLRNLTGVGIAIATGCWATEAIFKLQASGLNVAGIPMATSDDDGNRKRIMQTAVERARAFYTCPGFEQAVYLGDGPWDLQEAHSLGERFIGIGPRLQSLQTTQDFPWHRDYLELEAVLASIAATLKP
jgi:phosphoglycolate phosphatase-like HAD superfamily hydrolase